jgi:hypothetical protein
MGGSDMTSSASFHHASSSEVHPSFVVRGGSTSARLANRSGYFAAERERGSCSGGETHEVDALLPRLVGDALYALDLGLERIPGRLASLREDFEVFEMSVDFAPDLGEERRVKNFGGRDRPHEHNARTIIAGMSDPFVFGFHVVFSFHRFHHPRGGSGGSGNAPI